MYRMSGRMTNRNEVIRFKPSGIIPVAHCLLNPYSKVKSSNDYSQVSQQIIIPLIEQGFGILQLPCPEFCHSGLQRWGQTRSQYDNPFFREHCRHLSQPIIMQLEEYFNQNIRVGPILGIEGSPSCAVSFSFDGFWGGEPLDREVQQNLQRPLEKRPEPGVFIEVLQKELALRQLEIPFLGINEEKIEESMKLLFSILHPSN